MEIRAIGIDLGKSMFHLAAVDARGQVLERRKLSRVKLLQYTGTLRSCLIGMEAGAGGHYLGRRLLAQGHDVRLMPAQYVRPYVKSSHKNDILDAEGIDEAVQRPTMRFVPLKDAGAARSPGSPPRAGPAGRATDVGDQPAAGIPLRTRNHHSPGATALVAAVGNATSFAKGRDLAAWLGLVPRQSSTGGRTRLLGISKRGNPYVRRLLILGAHSVLISPRRERHGFGRWLLAPQPRAHPNVVVVALANKLARIASAV